eukprot:Sspe_Gene.118124::Locus_110886_Transcript_1_1_Confidence_1.000_Length_566::g.118124::m.118124
MKVLPLAPMWESGKVVREVVGKVRAHAVFESAAWGGCGVPPQWWKGGNVPHCLLCSLWLLVGGALGKRTFVVRSFTLSGLHPDTPTPGIRNTACCIPCG